MLAHHLTCPTLIPKDAEAQDFFSFHDRYQAVAAVGEALEAFLKAKHEEGLIVGSIGAGGSGGTSLIAPALRALPVGVPKAIVSTG